MPIEILDKILLYIKANSKFATEDDIKAQLTDKELLHYDRAIAYLEKQGYVKSKETLDGTRTTVRTYITFEGLLLLEQGGYAERLRKESNQATLQSWQTWAIVLGTLFAGVYAFVEIYKWIVSCP